MVLQQHLRLKAASDDYHPDKNLNYAEETLLHPHPVDTNWKEARRQKKKKREREETHGGSKGRERCYGRNEKPTHVHINVLHSTMSPSHRKKGSIYRQHSSSTVPPWSVSEERVVFPFQGLWLWRILLVYRREPHFHFTSQCFSRCMRRHREL